MIQKQHLIVMTLYETFLLRGYSAFLIPDINDTDIT